MKRLILLLVAISFISVACSTGGATTGGASEKELTGTVTDVSYFTTAGAGNVTVIIVEEQNGTKHRLSTPGIIKSFKEGQQIRVVFKEGGKRPIRNASSTSWEKVEKDGVIKPVIVYWWTILEYEILS